jgi:hypothetical protein
LINCMDFWLYVWLDWAAALYYDLVIPLFYGFKSGIIQPVRVA